MTSPHSLPDDSRRSSRVGERIAVSASVAVLAVSLAVGIWVVHEGSDQEQTSAPEVQSPQPSGDEVPSILSRRFVGLAVAEHARDVLVGVGARPGGPIDLVVMPSDGSVVAPERVEVRLGNRLLSGADVPSCGRRCLRFPLPVLGGARSVVEVDVERPGKPPALVRVPLPARLPSRAETLFRSAQARMLGLRSFTMTETIGTGLSSTPVVSSWTFQAPDRMRYTIVRGNRAVVIGTRRWDSLGRSWEQSSISKLRIPAFAWENAREARLVGRATVGGTRTRVLALWKPDRDFPSWFLLYVADDGRVLRARMATTAHFMVDAYDDFDSAPLIRRPA
jgi:hypothetical protein